MNRLIFFWVALLTFFPIPAKASGVNRRPWCDVSRGAPSLDWVKLTEFDIIPVSRAQRAGAITSLARSTILPISRRAANRLVGTGHRTRIGQLFLVRAGFLGPPGIDADQMHNWLSSPTLLDIGWSERLRALSITTLTSLQESPVYYDIPLILRISVHPRYVYVSCISTTHPRQ